MKTIYRIYKYESRNEIIPRQEDGFYLPSDIEEAVMANNIVEDAIDTLVNMLREDWELRCAVIDDFITTCDENHTWISENDIPAEIDDEDADTYIDVLDAELVSAIARNINKLTVAKEFTEFASLCKRVIADDED